MVSLCQNLNFTGFRKILKKHDKIFETARGADWRVAHVEVAPFYTCKKITQLISETEVPYTQMALSTLSIRISNKKNSLCFEEQLNRDCLVEAAQCLVILTVCSQISRALLPQSWKEETDRKP